MEIGALLQLIGEAPSPSVSVEAATQNDFGSALNPPSLVNCVLVVENDTPSHQFPFEINWIAIFTSRILDLLMAGFAPTGSSAVPEIVGRALVYRVLGASNFTTGNPES